MEGIKTELDLEVNDHLIKTFNKFLQLDTARQIVDELLTELAKPPGYSSIRINHIKYSSSEAIASVTAIIHKTYTDRGVESPPEIHHILTDTVLVKNIVQSPSCSYSNRVIVDKECGSAVLRGADVFAPGVLGAHKGASKGDVVSVFTDVDGNCLRGMTQYNGRVIFVGNGVLLQDRNDWFGSTPTSGVAVDMTRPVYVSPRLAHLSCDLYHPQNLPSIVVSHVINPQPGDTVLDMCASPGGKTAHIATLMKDKGCLLAIDRTSRKVVKLKETVEFFNLKCVHCYEYDSTQLIDTTSGQNSLPCPPPYLPESFDKILLDGPCSGLGQRPCVRYSLNIREVESYQKYQRKLIHQAVGLLKVDGVLVYSTCTILPQENEEQVAWILKEYPSLILSEQSPVLGYPGLPSCGLSVMECSHLQRFGPRKLYSNQIFKDQNNVNEIYTDTICFFIAKFIKK